MHHRQSSARSARSAVRPRAATAPGVALALMLVCAMPSMARADRITLADGSTFVGTVVSRSADEVVFDLDLFRTGDNGAPERLRLTIPIDRQTSAVATDRQPAAAVTLPSANATPADKLAAAQAIIRHGGNSFLSEARQLLEEVASAAPAVSPDDVAAALLRFRLADLVAAFADAAADGNDARATLIAEFGRLRGATGVIADYIGFLALQQTVALQVSARRNRLVDQLRRQVSVQREAFIAFVRRKDTERQRADAFDDAAWRRELRQRLSQLQALIATPGSPAALVLAPLAHASVARLNTLLQLCEAVAANPETAADRAWLAGVQAVVTDRTSAWRARLPADSIVGYVDSQTDAEHGRDDSLREINTAIDALNTLTFDDMVGRFPRGRLEDEFAVFGAVNAYRAMLGLPHLVFENRLHSAACKHAEWCATNRQLIHEVRVNGSLSTPRTRAEAAGFRNRVVGENLCSQDDRGAQAALEAWQLSPGHHLNLLRDDFSTGAVSRSGGVWCMMFGGSAR